MNTLARHAAIAVVIGVVGLFAAADALALGFRNPDQGARATAQGEAFVAQADDASAIYYNPGGLTQLEGTHVSGGALVSFRDIRFNGAVASEEMNDPAYIPHAYVATDLGLEKWRFGLGVNVPFGTDVDWGQTGTFRYLLTEAGMMVVNFAPTAAYKVNDHLSIGASLNVYHGETELNRLVPFSILFSAPDGRFRFEGDGQALGATVGVLWKINEHHTAGVVYRSPFSINFEGSAVVRGDVTGFFGKSPASAEIDFPQSVAVGYAFRPNDKLKLEADIEWTNWDVLNTVQLRSPNAAFATDPASTIPFHWMDSFFYQFGAQYALDEHWAARAGYIFSENSVPQSTFSPFLPDSDRHVFSVGLGYANARLAVDVAYQYSLSDDRTVSGSADTNFDGVGDVDGQWKSDAHAVIVTSTIKF